MEVVHHKDVFGEKIKNATKMVADEFINGGHLLGLNGAFIGVATMLIFDLAFRWEIILMIYFVIVAVYGFDHYHDLKNDSFNSNARVEYIQRMKHTYPYQLAIFILCYIILLLIFGTIHTIILGICILFLGTSYSLWFKRITRTIVGFKGFYVALTIALGIAFTAFFYHTSISMEIMFFIGYIGVNIFLNCSFCDIKDMKSDKELGLKTLPLVLGKQRFFIFLVIMNTLLLSVLGLLVYIYVIPLYFLSLICFNILWFLVIYKGMRPNINYHRFSSRILDSMEIFMFIFLFAGKIIISIHMV